MGRLNDLLSEDTNQFGPGTDLTISLLAVLLVISLITSHLYSAEKLKRQQTEKTNRELADKAAALAREVARAQAAELASAKRPEPGGNFKLASELFTAADFYPRPVTRLIDPRGTSARVARIVSDYRQLAGAYPYIFVIGHSSELDDPDAADRSVNARRRRNMEYALRRAALITSLLQEHLSSWENERLLAASSGEFDLRNPSQPDSQENAWVEVVFGREWKLPGRGSVP
jgi:hypothetical protein